MPEGGSAPSNVRSKPSKPLMTRLATAGTVQELLCYVHKGKTESCSRGTDTSGLLQWQGGGIGCSHLQQANEDVHDLVIEPLPGLQAGQQLAVYLYVGVLVVAHHLRRKAP